MLTELTHQYKRDATRLSAQQQRASQLTMFKNTTVYRKDRLKELKEREPGYFDLEFIKAMPPAKRNRCLELLDSSKSQLRQDVFGLAQVDFKANGFFVEFGATDGVTLNNSWLMENEFNWQGILAEPARGWHDDLHANRKCRIDTRCVWRESGCQISFTEAIRGENSAISSFMKTSRKLRGRSYSVGTVSLNELLETHEAPSIIDYISIDTEGSEFDILNSLDFEKWSFRTLTVEHNFAAQRHDICQLLTSKGYARVNTEVSRFDDWYVALH